MMALRFVIVLGFLILGGTLLGAAEPATAPAVGPKDRNGLTATLVVNKDLYTLDPAQSGKDLRDKIDAMRKGTGRPPAPRQVDMVLRLTNTTEKEVTISVGGDDSNVSLKVEGPGAINIMPNMPMTREFRMGKPVAIGAGKTADIKIT